LKYYPTYFFAENSKLRTAVHSPKKGVGVFEMAYAAFIDDSKKRRKKNRLSH
jgi:hypothetical protein